VTRDKKKIPYVAMKKNAYFVYVMGNFVYVMGNFVYVMGNFVYVMGNFVYVMGNFVPSFPCSKKNGKIFFSRRCVNGGS